MPEIINLKKRPGYLEQVARWHQDEWHHLNPGETLEQRIERMQVFLTDSFIPSMFISVDQKQLLGTAAIVEHDMDNHPEMSPWLASVYVARQYRGKNIGSTLVEHVTAQAQVHAVKRLFLFTPDRENFYRRLGWSAFKKETYHDEQVVLMRKFL